MIVTVFYISLNNSINQSIQRFPLIIRYKIQIMDNQILQTLQQFSNGLIESFNKTILLCEKFSKKISKFKNKKIADRNGNLGINNVNCNGQFGFGNYLRQNLKDQDKAFDVDSFEPVKTNENHIIQEENADASLENSLRDFNFEDFFTISENQDIQSDKPSTAGSQMTYQKFLQNERQKIINEDSFLENEEIDDFILEKWKILSTQQKENYWKENSKGKEPIMKRSYQKKNGLKDKKTSLVNFSDRFNRILEGKSKKDILIQKMQNKRNNKQTRMEREEQKNHLEKMKKIEKTSSIQLLNELQKERQRNFKDIESL